MKDNIILKDKNGNKQEAEIIWHDYKKDGILYEIIIKEEKENKNFLQQIKKK